MKPLNIVIFGLSITSSWGNGHATTYRSLVKALAARNHQITFLEQDAPWYAAHRDLPDPPFCRTILYRTIDDIDNFESIIAQADLVILGSYVTQSGQLTDKITLLTPPCFAFYDIDTPVTLAKLAKGDFEYLRPEMIPRFDIYLSFSGGPILNKLEQQYGAQRARALYCSVDTDLYHPPDPSATDKKSEYALGYLGTYSDDRQPTVRELLIEAAERSPSASFRVAGAQYPANITWPSNISRIEHIPPHQHRSFYHSQRFTLNVTRRNMISAGYSPSVRLFEAGACGTPIISDYWQGLDSLFDIGKEVLVAQNSSDVLQYLDMDDNEMMAMGQRLRNKVLASHTAGHRAIELEHHWQEVADPNLVVSQQTALPFANGQRSGSSSHGYEVS